MYSNYNYFKKQCFIRFTDLNKQLVRMCLDVRADGIIFSTIETPQLANEIIKYYKNK